MSCWCPATDQRFTHFSHTPALCEFDGMQPSEWMARNWRRFICTPNSLPVLSAESHGALWGAQGIYFLWRDGRLLYIGLATDAGRRLLAHRRAGRIPFNEVTFLRADGHHFREHLLRGLECAYIRALTPQFNTHEGHDGRWAGMPRMSKVIRRLWSAWKQ